MEFTGLSDRAIMRELGHRLKRRRLQKNLSQEMVAERAGISRSTVALVEKGAPTGLQTFLQIVRAIGVLDELEPFLQEDGISPIALAKMKGRERRRASGTRTSGTGASGTRASGSRASENRDTRDARDHRDGG